MIVRDILIVLTVRDILILLTVRDILIVLTVRDILIVLTVRDILIDCQGYIIIVLTVKLDISNVIRRLVARN